MKKILGSLVALLAWQALGEISFDAGADLRIRQELMENVPVCRVEVCFAHLDESISRITCDFVHEFGGNCGSGMRM